MNNTELEQKILEILSENNYFEMVLKMKEFEPEYKKSDFYKITKKPLTETVKEAKIYYALQFKDLAGGLQEIINNISLEHVNQLLDQIGLVFGQENKDILSGLEVLKDLKD